MNKELDAAFDARDAARKNLDRKLRKCNSAYNAILNNPNSDDLFWDLSECLKNYKAAFSDYKKAKSIYKNLSRSSDVLVLSEQDSQLLKDNLENPSEPSDRLKSAVKKYLGK